MNHFLKMLGKNNKDFFLFFFSSKTVHLQERVLFLNSKYHISKNKLQVREGLKNKTTSALFQESRLLTKKGPTIKLHLQHDEMCAA